jgi:hypothetical protein
MVLSYERSRRAAPRAQTRVRPTSKSEAVVHFDQDNVPIANASFLDDGAVHIVVTDALA